MAKLEQRVENIDEKVVSIERKLDLFIEASDRRYASKLTETIVYSMAGIILTAVLYLLLAKAGVK